MTRINVPDNLILPLFQDVLHGPPREPHCTGITKRTVYVVLEPSFRVWITGVPTPHCLTPPVGLLALLEHPVFYPPISRDLSSHTCGADDLPFTICLGFNGDFDLGEQRGEI